jgi:hypothetical protein
VTFAVRAVIVPFAGTFLTSSGLREAVRVFDPPVPNTVYVVVILSVDAVSKLQEYGIVSLQVRVVVPVAGALSDSLQKTPPVDGESTTVVPPSHVTLVMPTDLTVMVSVTVMVPPNTAAAGASASTSVAVGTGRNAPVCGSR